MGTHMCYSGYNNVKLYETIWNYRRFVVSVAAGCEAQVFNFYTGGANNIKNIKYK
jgi:hypothetical protein